jgi:hypothetical protein
MERDIPIGQQALGLDALALIRLFVKIANAADRQRVIALATSLARDDGAPIAPR